MSHRNKVTIPYIYLNFAPNSREDLKWSIVSDSLANNNIDTDQTKEFKFAIDDTLNHKNINILPSMKMSHSNATMNGSNPMKCFISSFYVEFNSRGWTCPIKQLMI